MQKGMERCFLCLAFLCLISVGVGSLEEDVTVTALMPEYPTTEMDSYLCTAVDLPSRPLKLVRVDPQASQVVAHHMLLFGKVLQRSEAPLPYIYLFRLSGKLVCRSCKRVVCGFGSSSRTRTEN
jgi:hypothetical protein